MADFSGFEGKARLTPIPAQFFRELLPAIDHLGELKVTLYAFWKLDRKEGDVRYLRRQDFSEDALFMQGLADRSDQCQMVLDEALRRAVERGTLLMVELPPQPGAASEQFYFLNSPRGRAAVQAVRTGKWRPQTGEQPGGAAFPTLDQERPNIFRLYEENIGPLTPLIADLLREAEAAYPEIWIEEAVKIAVQRNARNWRFIEAVLKRWKEQGRNEQDRRDTEKDGKWYLEDDYAQYTEHG